MSRLEVLVTTMHQSDLSKYKTMNLKTDAVIANQAERNKKIETIIDGHHVVMLTTTTRGTSKNRNIAIEHSSGEYLLFSDDDLVFYDDYEQTIEHEFDIHPEAEAIRFNVQQIAGRKTLIKPINEWRKAKRRKITGYGVCGVVVKRSVLEKNRLRFDESFGPGTANSCGEDTIFLQEMMKKKIAFYLSDKFIADIDQTESTWFRGYDEDYFITAGKVLARIYPIFAYVLVVRSSIRCVKNKKSRLPFFVILRCYYTGVLHMTLHGK